MNDEAPNHPPTQRAKLSFWEYQWVIFSRFGAGVLLVVSLEEPAAGLTLIGLSVLIAGHAITKAIRETR